MDQGTREPPPLFVVGCGRSGTTLLRLLLNAHPDLAIPPEAQFVDRLRVRRAGYERGGGGFDRESMIRDLVADHRFAQWGVPEDLLRERARTAADFASVITAAFESYAAQRGKTRWGNKTPDHVRVMPDLANLWPTGRFIHLIRDGRDVAASLAFTPFGPKTVVEQARYWAKRVRAGRVAGNELGASRYREVRYEALVTDPERELRSVCVFADLPFDPAMLAHHERSEGAIPAEELGHQDRALEPVRSGIRDWRVDMSPRDVDAFEAAEGRLLDELGYPRGGKPAPAAWAKARVSEARETIDLRRRVRRALGRTKGRP